MKTYLYVLFAALQCVFAGIVSAEDKPMFLPFSVTVDGQKASVSSKGALFATLAKEVKADAEVVIEKSVPLLVINAFPCNEKGEVASGAAASVVMGSNTDKVKLSATIDKKQFKPGRYLMNIVADGTTARVMFVVKQ